MTSPFLALPELRPGQSVDLLKALHILTRDGKLNQDSRRKLKQVYHLYQFIEPLLLETLEHQDSLALADPGAGKSYLGFILYDLFFKHRPECRITGIEQRLELVENAQRLAGQLGFERMDFFPLSIEEATRSPRLSGRFDVVTALHACDTATDDAIRFAFAKKARHIVLAPCCQAEVAAALRAGKGAALARGALAELWRHPLHTREFGSHVTNVLRCLLLEARGYRVTVTELIGWEHAMKNELIIARWHGEPRRNAAERARQILEQLGLSALEPRFLDMPS